jgi:hypothetical protein
MGSLTTGVNGTVNLPLRSPSKNTWKHNLTAFKSMDVGWFRWLNPAENHESATAIAPALGLTHERVHFDLFAHPQRILYVLLLDALDPQVRECDAHGIRRDLHSTNALLAALPSDQVVRMGPVGLVFGDARHHHHGSAFVSHDLDGREGFVLWSARRPRDRTGRTPLALIPKPQRFGRRLLDDLHLRPSATLMHLLLRNRGLRDFTTSVKHRGLFEVRVGRDNFN